MDCGRCGEIQEPISDSAILEFYAATEEISLYNAEGEPGAIGRIPPFLAHRLPTALVKFDFDRNEPIRNARGFARFARRMKSAKPLEKFRQSGRTSTASSKAIRAKRIQKKSCAMCSSKATHGFEPVI
jgi:hypothetical protein